MSYTKKYKTWMLELIASKNEYTELYEYLDDVIFIPPLAMDENRSIDGVDLRYRFGYDKSIPDYVISTKIDIRPSSMLEVMIALCLRMEEGIMNDETYGNRLPVWFGQMIDSLGLQGQDNSHFNREYCDNIIQNFLERRYSRNGQGGLFTINGATNIPDVDIWTQMNEYLVKEVL